MTVDHLGRKMSLKSQGEPGELASETANHTLAMRQIMVCEHPNAGQSKLAPEPSDLDLFLGHFTLPIGNLASHTQNMEIGVQQQVSAGENFTGYEQYDGY